MLASEVISRLADAISRHGDCPVVAYHERAQELVEVDGVHILEDTEFTKDSMETEQTTIFEIEY